MEKPRIDYEFIVKALSSEIPKEYKFIDEFVLDKHLRGKSRIRGHAIVFLRHLIDNSFRSVPYDEISVALWKCDDVPDLYMESVRIYIYRLRRMLKPQFHIVARNKHCQLLYVENEMPFYKNKLGSKNPKKRSPAAASLKEGQFQKRIIGDKKKRKKRRLNKEELYSILETH